MKRLIDKDAVVAEIDKKIYYFKDYEDRTVRNIACNILNRIKQDINSLEVKEVDLDFMLHEYWNISPKICVDCLESATMTKDEMINFAKHFFELGMRQSNNDNNNEEKS